MLLLRMDTCDSKNQWHRVSKATARPAGPMVSSFMDLGIAQAYVRAAQKLLPCNSFYRNGMKSLSLGALKPATYGRVKTSQ